MSRQAWEYASVVWTDTTRKITEADPEFSRLPPDYVQRVKQANWPHYYWRKQAYFIWLPGASKADERIAWETDYTEYRAKALDINNELGADGWELVAVTVRGSKVAESQGWPTASAPIWTNASFKRPVLPE